MSNHMMSWDRKCRGTLSISNWIVKGKKVGCFVLLTSVMGCVLKGRSFGKIGLPVSACICLYVGVVRVWFVFV